ncbi:DUF4403 family protein [Cetobacterium ceti]
MNRKKNILLLSTFILLGSSIYGNDNLSQVDLNISVKKSFIENIINKELPTTMTDSGSGSQLFGGGSKNDLLSLGLNLLGNVDKKYTEKFRWNYSITRDPIAFSAKGQNIQGVANFNGTLKAQWDRETQGVDANLKGTAGISSNIVINKNWEIIAESTPIFTISQGTLPLKLNIYGMELKTDINVNKNIEQKIVSNLYKATDILDNKIREFDLRSLVEKQWLQLKHPILINQDYNLWLTVNPLDASYSNIVSDENNIGIKLGTNSQLHIYMGEKPKDLVLNSLPPMNYGEVKDTFNINLPITATYNALNKELQKNINNKTFSLPLNSKLTLKDIEIFNENNNLKIDTNIALNILGFLNPNAKVISTVNLKYNETNSSFDKSDFDYTLVTDSTLLKFADKFLHGYIKNKISEKVFSMKTDSYITLLKHMAQEKVNSINLEDKAILKTSISSLTLKNILVKKNYITIITNIQGKSNLEIISK